MRTAGKLILLLCVMGQAATVLGAVTNTTVNSTNRWAWASPVDWINCRTDSTNGAVFGEYVCSGYFWSSGTGWISLGNGSPTNKIRYTNLSTNDYGVNCYSNGMLRGSAWSPSYGWISFEGTGAPEVDFSSGVVSGYAWNAGLGWISFTNFSGYVESDSIRGGADTNGNTIADAWELTYTNVLGVIGATAATDLDSDGEPDRSEYVAGTNPRDGNEYLRITSVASSSGTNDLIWTCVPTRAYVIETNSCLTGGAGWLASTLGQITTDSISNTTVRLATGSATTCFFRVRVSLPLSTP